MSGAADWLHNARSAAVSQRSSGLFPLRAEGAGMPTVALTAVRRRSPGRGTAAVSLRVRFTVHEPDNLSLSLIQFLFGLVFLFVSFCCFYSVSHSCFPKKEAAKRDDSTVAASSKETLLN